MQIKRNLQFEFLFLFLIFTIPKNVSSTNIRSLLTENLEPLQFLQKASWFELKNFYYEIKNKPQLNRLAKSKESVLFDPDSDNSPIDSGDDDQVDDHGDLSQSTENAPMITVNEYFEDYLTMAENKLEEIIFYRMKTILGFLKEVLNSSNDWIDVEKSKHFKENIKPFFSEIMNLFSGNILFLETENGIYLFNYFGSNTPTSDLDYGLYLLTEPMEELSFFKEIEKIQAINNVIIQAAKKFLKLLDVKSTNLQEWTDLNGYPDMYVIYSKFFQHQNLKNFEYDLDWLYQNFFSSLMLRICFKSHLHMTRAWEEIKIHTHADKQKELMKNCYFIFLEIIDKYVEQNFNKFTTPIGYKENSGKSKTQSDVLDNFEKLYLMITWYRSLKDSYKKVFESKSFKKTLENNLNLQKFFKLISQSDGNDLIYQDVKFSQFLSIFFVEQETSQEQDQTSTEIVSVNQKIKSLDVFGQPNLLYMPMISGSFSLACEAYSTIGPLEFVKFKSDIEKGLIFMDCSALIEVYIDNFSMIISHIAQESQHLSMEIWQSQSISDVFSKYLKRAMSIFKLDCLNAYQVKIPFVNQTNLSKNLNFIDLKPQDEFTSNWIFGFYNKIIEAELINKNKNKDEQIDIKALCFRILLSVGRNKRLDQLLDEIFEFFELGFQVILNNLKQDDLFFFKKNVMRYNMMQGAKKKKKILF